MALSPRTRLDAHLARPAPAPLAPRRAETSSPSKRNPFARAITAAGAGGATVKRAALLPVREGVVSVSSPARCGDVPTTTTTAAPTPPAAAATTPENRRAPWRMLWRGGLEVGPDGWRLDGITFFAQLVAFSTPTDGVGAAAAAFAPPTPGPSDPALPSDADLCLSLESLRGRRYISVRGVETLSDAEMADGDDVQMGVASPLLSAFFTGILCRSPQLTPAGRTTTAVVLGLGDEGVDGGTVLVYGQRTGEGVLRLCVGRKRPPPPPAERVRPGEPLPRATPGVAAPAAGPSRAGPRRALSRASSLSAMYRPPIVAPARSTPGRRGEKRARRDATSAEADAARRRGRIVPDTDEAGDIFGAGAGSGVGAASAPPPPSRASSARPTRSASLAPSLASALDSGTTQQLQDNKAVGPRAAIRANCQVVRKQTMVLLGERGCARDHAAFTPVFGATTKGVYFALRGTIDTAPVSKAAVRDLVVRHLDMYFPVEAAAADGEAGGRGSTDEEPSERVERPPKRARREATPPRQSEQNTAAELMRTPQRQVH